MNDDTVTTVTPESLSRLREQHEQRSAAATEASRRIQAIRAEGRSDRGLVGVVVDGSALVVDVEFSPGAASSFTILGGAVKQAHDRAVTEWNRQVKAITEETLGDHPRLREHIQRISTQDALAHTDRDHDDPDASSSPASR